VAAGWTALGGGRPARPCAPEGWMDGGTARAQARPPLRPHFSICYRCLLFAVEVVAYPRRWLGL